MQPLLQQRITESCFGSFGWISKGQIPSLASKVVKIAIRIIGSYDHTMQMLTFRGFLPKISQYQLWSRSFSSEPGDKVAVDEPIAQIETDKVIFLVVISLVSLHRVCMVLRVSNTASSIFIQVTIDVVSPEAGVIEKEERLQENARGVISASSEEAVAGSVVIGGRRG
ncbi:hypothetical protein KSP40_PGU011797 [Platanthera guangdongensis]|uniref:Uncharacterized protein n=1 Tax=Platanthera guangdongensis TaxID=2320717 RepID=A0ABR2MU46_9ASPA